VISYAVNVSLFFFFCSRSFRGLDLLTFSDSELISGTLKPVRHVGSLGWEIGPKHVLYLHTTEQHRKMRTYILASSGIRTPNRSFRAVQAIHALDCEATVTGNDHGLKERD